ncbi:hypothetical protein [Thorsellia anophelis]|uniref:Uncharacterized protein n=1 Tax=Thorsellia anophelis DSM 18579 TaxID=1123402 RepID=A0A1I0D4D7_9GAMM|nr:hypothetical protein [Thorsellia anophelis]SET27065.1 hypothetical protein SAMN02583745_01842 [Thorsellia anophelis DSM 18579]
MKITNSTSITIFAMSPFFTGLALVLIFAPYDSNSFEKINYLPALMGVIGLVGLIFFCIPATIVGVIYVGTQKKHYVIQELICGISGVLVCVLWLLPGWWLDVSRYGVSYIVSSATYPFYIMGGITVLVVGRVLNFIKHSEMRKMNLKNKENTNGVIENIDSK